MKTAGESPAATGSAETPREPLELEGVCGQEGDPLSPPTLGDGLSAVFQAARAAWSPRLLLPAWGGALLLWLVWEFALPRLAAPPAGAIEVILRAGGVVATVVLIWLTSALIVVMSAWDYGRDLQLGLGQGLRFIGERLGTLLASLLFVPMVALVLLILICGGAAALGSLPAVGGWLSICWIIFPGFPLTLLLAGFLLLAVPGLPLILSAAALEAPFPFDAVARGLSYLRARPGRYLTLLLGGLLGAALGTAVFACFAGLILAILFGAARAREFVGGGGNALAGLWTDLSRAAASLDPAWPLWKRPSGAVGSEGLLLGAAGRALTGFAAAATLAALARTYLLLRWTLDGESPAALLRPDEDFDWVEGKGVES